MVRLLFLIFGHLQQWKFAQQNKKFADIVSKFYKYYIPSKIDEGSVEFSLNIIFDNSWQRYNNYF